MRCITHFDITQTGTRHGLNRHRFPFTDQSGTIVNDDASWQKSRNQQRNWDTLNQIISLRALPENVSMPVKDTDIWTFEFEIPSGSTGGQDAPLGMLISDCTDVPMIIGLDERASTEPMMRPDHNVWFSVIEP